MRGRFSFPRFILRSSSGFSPWSQKRQSHGLLPLNRRCTIQPVPEYEVLSGADSGSGSSSSRKATSMLSHLGELPHAHAAAWDRRDHPSSTAREGERASWKPRIGAVPASIRADWHVGVARMRVDRCLVEGRARLRSSDYGDIQAPLEMPKYKHTHRRLHHEPAKVVRGRWTKIRNVSRRHTP